MKEMVEWMDAIYKSINWESQYDRNPVRATVEDAAVLLMLILKIDDDGKIRETEFFNDSVKVLCGSLSEMMKLDPEKDVKYEIRRVPLTK